MSEDEYMPNSMPHEANWNLHLEEIEVFHKMRWTENTPIPSSCLLTRVLVEKTDLTAEPPR
eukprot:scaffold27669_cov72-Skeletonema_dohrnii-CCMP3373.AAC.1